MYARTALTTAALLCSALLSPSTAVAAGATCRGEAATIVGDPAKNIVDGTPGRDVVVTNGAQNVKTYTGDDLICVTKNRGNNVAVDSGPGDDVVDGTAAPKTLLTDVRLGSGSDLFAGGPGTDRVLTGELSADFISNVDTDIDVINTGAGRDHVRSGQQDQANGDAIDLGSDDDNLVWEGNTWLPGASITGGDGTLDTLALRTLDGDNAVDNAAGTFHVNGTLVASWSGMEGFSTWRRSELAHMSFVGSPLNESVEIFGEPRGLLTADLGGGDDFLAVQAAPTPGSRVAGGAGRNTLYTGAATRSLRLDMRRETLRMGGDNAAVTVTGFRDATLIAPRVQVTGDRKGNVLEARGCRMRLDGKGGNDTLEVVFDYYFEAYRFDCAPASLMMGRRGKDTLIGNKGRDRLFGGPGHDTLKGRAGPDLLVGGKGWDHADGGAGWDRCVAEKRKRCERC